MSTNVQAVRDLAQRCDRRCRRARKLLGLSLALALVGIGIWLSIAQVHRLMVSLAIGEYLFWVALLAFVVAASALYIFMYSFAVLVTEGEIVRHAIARGLICPVCSHQLVPGNSTCQECGPKK